MKKLILYTALLSLPALAINEISDKEITNRFGSMVKDAEVEKHLNELPLFVQCKSEYKDSVDKATACFKNKLPKDEAQLKELSDKLGLESYGLVQSKNISDVSKYLTTKMEKALTGVDPYEKDEKKKKEDLVLGKRKFVDQKVFIELYQNQLGKAALQEISRFCFENLRISGGGGDNFNDHWQGNIGSDPAKDVESGKLNDNSSPPFKIQGITDYTKKEQVLQGVIGSITSNDLNPALLTSFFPYCQGAIKPLCDKFKKSSFVKDAAADKKVVGTDNKEPGANACFTTERLQSIRTALKNTKLIIDQMDKQSAEDQQKTITLALTKPLQVYQGGNGAGEESLDQLTTVSSADLLENQDASLISDLEKCENGQGNNCDQLMVDSDKIDTVTKSIEMNNNMKREIELQRIEELKKDKKKLSEYLESNGYLDLLAKLNKDGSLSDSDLKDAITDRFNALKVAEIERLQSAVGARQITAQDAGDATEKQKKIKEASEKSIEERARLAQVVMFNNIITSHLDLYKKDAQGNTQKMGRNINAWKTEQKGLEGSKITIDNKNFANIKQTAEKDGKNSPSTKNTSIVDIGFIDTILGKPQN